MRQVIFVLVLLLSVTAAVNAQDTLLTQLPPNWTLQNCIDYAKKNNIQLNILRLTTASTKEDLLQSKANRQPNLAGSVSQTIVNSKNTDPVVGGFQTQASFSSGYSVSSSTTIYNGGFLKNDIRQKDLLVQAANLNVEESANDITLSITQSFLNVLLAKENINSLQEVLTTSQEQLKQGQERYDAGSISKKDFLQLQSQLASDQYNLVNANNNYLLNIVTLKQLLQLPTSYNFMVATPDSIEVAQPLLMLSDAQQMANDSRPEVKNGQLFVNISQLTLDKARAAGRPSIAFNANLSSGFANGGEFGYFPQLNNNFYQSAGVTMAIPIFNRRATKTSVNKSKIAIEQAKLDLLNTKTVLNQQVEQAYINLQNSLAQFTAAQTQLKATEESYHITNEQLKLGAINSLEVLQEKNLYVQALQAYNQAKYTAVLYNKIYAFYAGTPVTL